MHLLVETAIIDSNEYEVLSFEEVEELKKEYKFLAGRIDAAKRKLALESKVRDAALSLSRLYNKKSKRRSLLGGKEVTQKTDEELIQSNQKVEQLVQELWGLNNRAVEIQRRLLQHAAGILGMTHQGGIRPQASKAKAANSRPSIQGHPHVNGDEFDDRSLYRTSDNLDGIVTNGIYTNRRLQNNRASMRVESNGHGVPRLDPHVEHRLEQLNIDLRRFLIASTGIQEIPAVPQPTGDIPGLHEQITMLEEGIKFFQSQPLFQAHGNPAAEELEQNITTLWDMLVLGNEDSRTRRATTMNGKGNVGEEDSEDEDGDAYGTAFSIEAFSYKVQSLYTKATKLRADRSGLRRELKRQRQIAAEEREAFQQSIQSKEEEYGLEVMKLEQEIDQLNETILSRDKDLTTANKELDTLTDEIKNIQEESRDREDERDQAREDLEIAQQELVCLRYAVEERKKADTQNQDNQDIAKEMELISRVEAEDALRGKLRAKTDELADLQSKFREIEEDLNVTKAEHDAAKAELGTIIASTEARFKALEGDLEQLKQARAAAEAGHALTKEQSESLRLEIEQKDKQIEKMDIEMRELIEKVAQLSTEAVIAKAELDQAYGSKSQRAAETAAAAHAAAAREAAKTTAIDPAFLQELDVLATQNKSLFNEISALKAANSSIQNLEKRNQLLQAELNGMLQDFEGLTKQSIEFENERTQLEGMIDKLREKAEALEAALADERVRMLGSRSLSASSNGEFPRTRSGGESTSTQVLKTEFKKMMRDMRAEQMKALRVSLTLNIRSIIFYI
ncbi:Up-regulated during septation-domain-containing protein [Tirmania nivea]|nr:Up-regulated during septation-domain-containing protein [Tirmania nivea]